MPWGSTPVSTTSTCKQLSFATMVDFVVRVVTYGPDWQTFVSLLVVVTALITAINASKNDAYRRRKGTLQ